MSERSYTILIDYKHDKEDVVIYQLKFKGVAAREIIHVINFISDHVEVLKGIIIMPERGDRQ